MSRGSPTRGQTTRDKDSKPVSPNQSINQANQPVLARPSTMVVEISMSALHQTKSLELQKSTKLMKGREQTRRHKHCHWR
ncbi:hypothetical protein GW17_00055792 [Ensete ventricosum]|nr:hypothetical protein GW17_00055792 [Ensete ventricosum]